MCKRLSVLLQYIAPQHALTRFAGWMANHRWPWLKNQLINWFIKRYNVDMTLAVIESPEAYSCFNTFFTRYLKPELRPIAQGNNQIACPADGTISQIGKIQQDTLLQAKGFNYHLSNLLGGTKDKTDLFYDGHFATIYLSPRDYHRVHMPFSGQLTETKHIPGTLFSVNAKTVDFVPNLFTRNERLICFFNTECGPMVVILVGAMIVGSIHTVWEQAMDKRKITTQSFATPISLNKGQELGHFQLGSTVIVLFGKNQVNWVAGLQKDSTICMGQRLGTLLL